eukprot:scaffold182536_cov36-Tisochrysis_lutea.AAC.1
MQRLKCRSKWVARTINACALSDGPPVFVLSDEPWRPLSDMLPSRPSGGAGAVSGQTEIVICVSDELEWS